MQSSDIPETQVAYTHTTSSNQQSPRGRISRWLSKGAALLVIAIIVGASLILFTSRQPSATGSTTHGSPANRSTPVTPHVPAGPVVAHIQAGGLEFSMRITPGPYFLSELFLADLTLTNHTHTTFTLAGPSAAGPCGAALYLAMTGGTAPNYSLPVADDHSCPPMRTSFKPAQTLTFYQFTPLSSSGDITLTPGANFLHTQADPNGGQAVTSGPSPLDGHWPSIKIHVSAHIPADRIISLQQKGNQVIINAPKAARSHLYYIYNVSCDAFQGGTVGTGNYAWEAISTTTLHQPDCGDYGNQNIRWYYAVSAPGYAIVSGRHPAS